MILMLQDDFIDKNRKDMPNVLLSMIQKSKTLSEISYSDFKHVRTSKTLASSLKFEIDTLIEQLKKTVTFE